jgi:hypothetical protein
LATFAIVDDPSIQGLTAPGRGNPTASRLEEHLQSTAKRLKKLGVRPGACVASALPEGPDLTTAAMTASRAQAKFAPLPHRGSCEQYQSLLLKSEASLLLLHAGSHPAREAALNLRIPIANVLRHFEAGVFTLEADIPLVRAGDRMFEPPRPSWKRRGIGVPVVLIAPGPSYRRLANRLDATNPVVGITPPSLEHLPLPHTIEHVAAECARMLRRYRPHGPYALAGWRTDAVVALEMARLLEEQGEKVIFVAMLDASSFASATLSRAIHQVVKFLRGKSAPPPDFMAEALRQYRPRPWFGKILDLRPPGGARLNWRSIAPQGVASYDAPSEMLAEPNVQTVATILAAELIQSIK